MELYVNAETLAMVYHMHVYCIMYFLLRLISAQSSSVTDTVDYCMYTHCISSDVVLLHVDVDVYNVNVCLDGKPDCYASCSHRRSKNLCTPEC